MKKNALKWEPIQVQVYKDITTHHEIHRNHLHPSRQQNVAALSRPPLQRTRRPFAHNVDPKARTRHAQKKVVHPVTRPTSIPLSSRPPTHLIRKYRGRARASQGKSARRRRGSAGLSDFPGRCVALACIARRGAFSKPCLLAGSSSSTISLPLALSLFFVFFGERDFRDEVLSLSSRVIPLWAFSISRGFFFFFFCSTREGGLVGIFLTWVFQGLRGFHIAFRGVQVQAWSFDGVLINFT